MLTRIIDSKTRQKTFTDAFSNVFLTQKSISKRHNFCSENSHEFETSSQWIIHDIMCLSFSMISKFGPRSQAIQNPPKRPRFELGMFWPQLETKLTMSISKTKTKTDLVLILTQPKPLELVWFGFKIGFDPKCGIFLFWALNILFSKICLFIYAILLVIDICLLSNHLLSFVDL